MEGGQKILGVRIFNQEWEKKAGEQKKGHQSKKLKSYTYTVVHHKYSAVANYLFLSN